MRISVVVPVYNCEKYLPLCADSILGQSYKQVELILVDDGSSDTSGVICDAYAQKDARVKVIHQANAGVSAARNAGLRAATGEYLTFVDGDDELFADALETMLNAAEINHADMVIGKTVFHHGDGKDIEESLDGRKSLYKGEEFLVKALEGGHWTWYAWRILYKTTFLYGLTFEEGRIVSEDGHFVFLCATKQPVVKIMDAPVYLYRMHSESVTHKKFTQKKCDDMLYFLTCKKEHIEAHYPHLKEKCYHLIVKTNMAILWNIWDFQEPMWIERKRQAYKEVLKYKDYYSAKGKKEKRLFLLLCYRLYSPYRWLRNTIRTVVGRLKGCTSK